MFVLQNCRGDTRNMADADTTTFKRSQIPMKVANVKHDLGDYIIFHGTLPGSPAYRNSGRGSYLVHELCRSLKAYPNEDILTHSISVTGNISQKLLELENGEEDVQICEVSHTLRKKFIIKIN